MENEQRILTLYGLFSFTHEYWKESSDAQKSILHSLLNAVSQAAEKTWFYQVYPTQSTYDILIWSNIHADELDAPNRFMEKYAEATNPFRRYIHLKLSFWGVTKPSVYSRAKKSSQELDPFTDSRKSYFVIYPFTKTTEWYLKSREDRQLMMNDHIRIGKQYLEISQLLLYSFGMQDQEFVVAYEMENLPLFSDLVYELRSTQARLYTLSDTPIITCTYKTADQLINIFTGQWNG